MTLYIIEGRGVWGDTKTHALPCTVQISGAGEISAVTINDKTTSACGGQFTIDSDKCGIIITAVNGTPCEALVCTNKGGTFYAHAAGADFRSLLPIVDQISKLKEVVDRHEEQLEHKDIFS